MRKFLIVHETDCHGDGYVMFNGNVMRYWHEDCVNMKEAVKMLIELGFLNDVDVCVLEGEEVYTFLNDALNDVQMLTNGEDK